MWGNKVSDLPESYIRFLTNGLRQTFGLGGGTDPLDSQEGENPYLERKGKEEVGGGA
jgi:GTP-binding protein